MTLNKEKKYGGKNNLYSLFIIYFFMDVSRENPMPGGLYCDFRGYEDTTDGLGYKFEGHHSSG